MIEVDSGSFFAIILVAALAAITVVALPARFAPPVVVLELLLGIVIGPQVLGLAESDDFIDFFSNLGLGMLFFFAGYEIDFERIKGQPLRLALLGWLLSLALAYGIGGLLAAAGIVLSLLYTGSALATTAIGTLIPILRDSGELKTRFGTLLLAAGATRGVRADPADHAGALDRPAAARGGDPGGLRRPRAGDRAALGAARLARASRRSSAPSRRAASSRCGSSPCSSSASCCSPASSASTSCSAASSPG